MTSTLKVDNIAHSGGTTGMTIGSSGVVDLPQTPRFSVYHTTNSQLSYSANDHFVTNSTIGHRITMVGFSFDDGVYTANVTGDYYTSFHGIKNSSGGVEWSLQQISGSSSGTKLTAYANDDASLWHPYGFAGMLPFVAGDTFKLVAPTVDATYEGHGQSYMTFSMFKIG